MTKRLVDVDDDLLEQARSTLNTGTMKETVNVALAEAVNAALRRSHIQRLIDREGLDLADADVMAGVWR